MAAVGHTRVTLREEVARFFGLHEGTATGGSTTTVVDSRLARYGNDYFNGMQVYLKTDAGGAGALPQGQSSYVTDFENSTGAFTFSPAMAAVASGDTYQIYPVVTKDQIDTALARVCKGALLLHDLTASATTLDYDITAASGLVSGRQVLNVWVRPLDDVRTMPYRFQGWHIEDNGGLLVLRLPGLLTATDGLWIEYVQGEVGLASDTAKVNLPIALVRDRAIVYLIENVLLSRQDQGGLQKWGTLLRERRELLLLEERGFQRPSGKARRHSWENDIDSGSGRAASALGLTWGDTHGG